MRVSLLALVLAAPVSAGEIEIVPRGGKLVVTAGGEPFTTVHPEGYGRPVLYPLVTSSGTRLNREFPFRSGVEGESDDHPHHQSLWFGHGDVNGHDFWKVGEGKGTVRVGEVVTGEASVTLVAEWHAPGGEAVLRDETTLGFGAEGTLRWIDYTVALEAAFGAVVFGDTKEGTMAVRTHPALRTRAPAGGRALNSEGDTGTSLWGKRAAWVAYWGEPGSITLFDHPKNIRHPTTWHARDYGLVAANPFGLHAFEGKPPGSVEFRLAEGEVLTLRYRVLLAPEPLDPAVLEQQAAAFSE